jgi:hypothetical protein
MLAMVTLAAVSTLARGVDGFKRIGRAENVPLCGPLRPGKQGPGRLNAWTPAVTIPQVEAGGGSRSLTGPGVAALAGAVGLARLGVQPGARLVDSPPHQLSAYPADGGCDAHRLPDDEV